jgi:capsular polysaccharide biosynthesis protein
MSYWETLLVIMRRWRISVPAALVALIIAIGTFLAVPPSYEDSVQVLFLGSPTQPGEKALVNPYLELGSTLVSTADVIRLKVSTPQVVEALAKEGATAEYGVALDQSTPAPVLIVTSKAADPAVAQSTGRAVVKEIQATLQDLQEQAGAPRSTWVVTSVLSTLPKPERKLNVSIRPAIVASGGFLALTIFVLFLREGRLRRRTPESYPVARPAAGAGRPQPGDPGRSAARGEFGGMNGDYGTPPTRPVAQVRPTAPPPEPMPLWPEPSNGRPQRPAAVNGQASAESGDDRPVKGGKAQRPIEHLYQPVVVPAPVRQVPRLLPAHDAKNPARKAQAGQHNDADAQHGDGRKHPPADSPASEDEGHTQWRR